MIEEELSELEELCNAATPGPWEWIEDDEGDWELVSGTPEQIMQQQEEAVVYVDLMPALRRDVVKALEEDRAFIAEARTAVPALIAKVRRLQSALDEANAELHDFDYMIPGGGVGKSYGEEEQ